MQARPVRAGRTLLFTSVLVLQLAFGGCTRQQPEFKLEVQGVHVSVFKCPDTSKPITIKVDAKGAHPKDIYLCANNFMKWEPQDAGVQSFKIVFIDPAFGPTSTTFDSRPGHDTTPAYTGTPPGELTVYKYNIIVTDATGVHEDDPHVVGGGGIGF